MPGNQNGEPYGNFQTLQEDAIRRAREMQARAHLPSYGPVPAGFPPAQREEPHPRAEQMPIHEPGPESARPAAPASAPSSDPEPAKDPDDPESGLLDFLLKDNERTLIWVLLLILLEEKADTALIFALMYLAT